MSGREGSINRVAKLSAALIILALLYPTSLYSYLLFHSLAEFFSIIVACGIFMVAWNSRRIIENNYFLFLGIAYLFIGSMDLMHTLAYKGMGIFRGYDANLPTQLWIAGRYLESISLLAAPIFIKRKLDANKALGGYLAVAGALLILIFLRAFPDCFVEGTGLTVFKKASEYVISLILLGSLGLLYMNRERFEKSIFLMLSLSIGATIVAELAFTFYVSVYGLSNLVGHYLKIISFYLIYRAIIETGLRKPYSLLFRELKKNEEALKESIEEKDMLMREIHHRVKNNFIVVYTLLKFQARNVKDSESQSLFKESQDRVMSMSLIHEKLYLSKDLGSISCSDYINNLARYLFDSYSVDKDRVSLNVNVSDVPADVDIMIPCGLIVNELISNSLKYAFPEDRSGEITIALNNLSDDGIELAVGDNGVGFPEHLDFRDTKTMGLELVTMLAKQLEGSVELERSNGTEFRIRFKSNLYKKRNTH
jgi:two-component sensor histidine kinase